VKFEVRAPAVIEALECNCSICTMSGFLHLIVARERFTLLQGAEALAEYRFNTGTARHLFCRTCGMKSFYVPRSHPEGTASTCAACARDARARRHRAVRRRRPREPRRACGADPGRAPRSGALAREGEPGLDHRIRVQRDALDALVEQPLREVRVVRRALAADADVLALALRQALIAIASIALTAVALVEQLRDDAESRSRPSVSCVMSFEPIDMPSKYSRYWSASTALVGSSHIMMTFSPFCRAQAVLASSSVTLRASASVRTNGTIT
jgi:hypothetical protein